MPVKAVICDVGGTLFDEHTGRPVVGVREMIDDLHRLGLFVFGISNRGPNLQAEAVLDNIPKIRFLHQVKKGSGRAVEVVKAQAGVNESEIVLLGNEDRDMHEASHAHIVYFNASWANPGYEYGIPMGSPQEFVSTLKMFFLKEHYWYWTLDDHDDMMRPITIKAMLNPEVADLTRIKGVLKGYQVPGDLQGYKTHHFMIMHFFASVFLDGVINHSTPKREPIWCIYPGASGTPNRTLATFEHILTRLLGGKFLADLLVRHSPADSQKFLRASGKTPNIADQFSTIRLNEQYRKRIEGNTVFVVDDFSTAGNAFETARNLLYKAGARHVVCLAVGKYGRSHQVASCNLHLAPYTNSTYTPQHFNRTTYSGEVNPQALTPFEF